MKSLENTPHGLAVFHADYREIHKKSTALLFSDFVPTRQEDSTYDKAEFYKAVGCGDYDTVAEMLTHNYIYIICNYRQVSLRHHINYITSSLETMVFFLTQNGMQDSSIQGIRHCFLYLLNKDGITERFANMVHYMAIYEFTHTAELLKRLSKFSDEVKLCINYLHKTNFEKNSLSTIADVLDINERQLSHLFQEEIGMSLQTFAHYRRVELAKLLLTLTELSTSEIAMLLNFSSDGYFKKVFKQYTKLSPKEFLSEYEKEKKKIQL